MPKIRQQSKSQFRIPHSELRISASTTYRDAGVDIVTADRLLERLKPLIRSTHGQGVLPDLGQFAGLFRLPTSRRRNPVLVSSTDGVGTKLQVAQMAGEHEAIGVDVVAMNTNDILVYGAAPLFFLDYIAIGKLDAGVYTQLLRGMVRGCRDSGCALLGGETAEMPGVYEPHEYDIAGFCVGLVDRGQLIDGSRVRAGDAVVGLASSGVHANGFSLIRKVFEPSELLRFKRELLAPTRIYVKPVLAMLRRVSIGAMAHVTGGGLSRRLPSLVAKHPRLTVRWVPGSWPAPKVFQRVQLAGRISPDEMRSTFNMGLGMVIACRARDAATVIRIANRFGVRAWNIGSIERKRH